jgi:integrase/recombinase XerC
MSSTLQHCVNVFLQVDRAQSTNQTYARILGAFTRAVGPERDVRLISPLDLLDYIHRLRPGRAPSTVCLHAQIIRILFGWCVRIGELETNPSTGLVVHVPAQDPSQSRAIPTEVLRGMIEIASPRDRAILLFFADSGCRLGGVVSLTLTRLDMARQCALLHEKGDRYYWVDFGPATHASLVAWLQLRPSTPDDAVFITERTHQGLHHETIASMVANLSRRVCGRAYRPHSIRHWVAETWAEAGESLYTIQGKLGHANQRTTERYFPPRSRNLADATRRRSINHLIDSDLPRCNNIIEVDFAAG